MFESAVQISLIPATIRDRDRIYIWLAESDLTGAMLGNPDFPDHPIPSFDAFKKDYSDFFFNGSKPHEGRSFLIIWREHAVGHICYHACQHTANAAELDIWLADSSFTGKGIGSAAIQILSQNLLATQFDLLIIAPSVRNKRAINAYYKAGFFIADDYQSDKPDYTDSVTMIKRRQTVATTDIS